jgi:hypothetical protein
LVIKQIPVDEAGLRKLIEMLKVNQKDAWRDLLRFLNTNPTKARILKRFFAELDNNKSFGSATAAKYANQSLEQLLKDERLT